MKYYKFLGVNNVSQYQNVDYTAYLPKDGKPGKWLPKIDRVEICDSGYHAFTSKNVLNWINAQLFEVEFKGDVVEGDNKVAGHQIRIVRKINTWNEKTARKFACYCARDVLPIYEKEYQNDNRVRKSIEVTELFADGKATEEELAVAGDAAWAAARDAARDAAWAAAWAAARDAARDAAWAAAGAAAWAAARAAAWDAAWAAAGAAAWAAAWAAAGAAAGAAARDVAEAAARDVAEAAARDAARARYATCLLEMLGIEEEK